jgi:hypothetical protein
MPPSKPTLIVNCICYVFYSLLLDVPWILLSFLPFNYIFLPFFLVSSVEIIILFAYFVLILNNMNFKVLLYLVYIYCFIGAAICIIVLVEGGMIVSNFATPVGDVLGQCGKYCKKTYVVLIFGVLLIPQLIYP